MIAPIPAYLPDVEKAYRTGWRHGVKTLIKAVKGELSPDIFERLMRYERVEIADWQKFDPIDVKPPLPPRLD